MKFMFIVQGEGRGHMTQAISLEQLLNKLGHEVCCVAIGKCKQREIPEFVYRKLKVPIFKFESPNFFKDKKGKGILISKTMAYNILRYRVFLKSLRLLDELATNFKPDIILNFYDILGGLYNFYYRPTARFWTIGHQYLMNHPDFIFAPHSPLQKALFKLNTSITSLGAEKMLALSFRPMTPNGNLKKLLVLPPLLRNELRNLKTSEGNYYLTYLVNAGYADEVLQFAKHHPEFKICVFWDKKGAPSIYKPLPNVTFHQLNDSLFLEKMANCKAFLSTAGFESICEAMYLGKSVLTMPVKGQYEQACNALDAVRSGAGITSSEFDFLKFKKYVEERKHTVNNSKIWSDSFECQFKNILDSFTDANGLTKINLPSKLLTT